MIGRALLALANAVWCVNRRLDWEWLYSLDGWLLSLAVQAGGDK
jgi:hypothetical protein